jgi:LAO/AO transport system kinase
MMRWLKFLHPKNRSFRIGITGSPGVGKSTFIESFGKYLSQSTILVVAVLAVDPSSKLNGGSILGDKTRMEDLSSIDNVFIRPSPSKGHLGGAGEQSYDSILLCEKAGFDVISF